MSAFLPALIANPGPQANMTTFTVSWQSASGGTGDAITEQLQESVDGGFTWTNVAGKTTSPATITGGLASGSYTYRVASTQDAVTIFSNLANFTVRPAIPGAVPRPTGAIVLDLSLSPSTINIHLVNASPDAASHNIYELTTPGYANAVIKTFLSNQSSFPYALEPVTAGQQVTLAVAPVGSDGVEGPLTDWRSVLVTGVAPAAGPGAGFQF